MNHVGKTGELHAKDSNWPTFLDHAQREAKNDLKT